MNVSLFDIIRHKVAIWVVFPLMLVLSVAMYQFAYYSPVAVVVELNQAQLNSLRFSSAQQKEQTPLDELGTTLQSVKELTNLTLSGVTDYKENQKSSFDEVLSFMGVETDTGMNLGEIETKLDRIVELETVALESFDDMYGYLIDINADSVIFERHEAAVEKFKSAMQPVKDIRNEFGSAGTLDEQQRLLNQLDEYLSTQQFKQTHTAEDFENGSLPFGPRNLQAREPLLDLSSLESSLYDSVDVAANVLTQDILRGLTAPSALPNADDLAETEEAPQTQEIIDLAASLNNDPVEIYNWVYNNIYSIPSYGAIQGAQYTMDLKAGNPFDTSALLLALLRAAGTPARYAYGTVQVPVGQVMNWVGGAEVPEAATNVMLQGGIPTVLQSYSGQITHVKMEHIWVEAWVDFEPSRGLVNNEGDHWIPMDASFKQYDFEAGMEVKTEVPFDADGLIQDLLVSAVIDEQAGFVQGLDQDVTAQALNNYQIQVDEYIENQNPNATAGDVLGFKRIPIKTRAPLSAGLPYQVIDRAPQIQNIPDSFKHKFRIKLDYDNWGTTAIDETYNTISLAGRNIAISFEPASQSDIDLIASYVPGLSEGSDIDITNLPNQLPGYLIYVKPELTVDGDTLMASRSVALGTELKSRYSMFDPAFGWSQSENKPIAGEYIAVGLDLQGIASKEMQSYQSIMFEIENSVNNGEIESFTKHDFVGRLLQSGIKGYFSLNDAQDSNDGRTFDQLVYRAPSYGQFQLTVNTQYWFGIPRNIEYPGVTMDVDSMRSQVASKFNDTDSTKNFNLSSGLRMSYLENFVPERMFSSESQQVEGISAAKGLAIADSQGQRIYTLDLTNLSSLSDITIDSDIRREIQNAIYSGKTVTTHETPLNYANWQGSVYVIVDEYGAAAYKIGGGANGGFLEIYESMSGQISGTLFLSGLLLGLVTNPAGWIVLSLIIIGLFHAFMNYLIADLLLYENGCPEGMHALLASMAALFALLPRFLKSAVMPLMSFIILKTVSASSPACRSF